MSEDGRGQTQTQTQTQKTMTILLNPSLPLSMRSSLLSSSKMEFASRPPLATELARPLSPTQARLLSHYCYDPAREEEGERPAQKIL